jgi:hypothetical protein
MDMDEAIITLTPLQRVHGLPLAWVQPSSWKHRYELRAGEDALIAVMEWDGVFKTTATAQTAEGVWHLRRKGFFKMFSEIQREGASEPALSMRSRWNRGGLTLPNGRTLEWRPDNFWSTHWVFADEATGQRLIEYRYGGFFKYHADLILYPEAEELPYLDLLIVLGWYALLMYVRDASAAAS